MERTCRVYYQKQLFAGVLQKDVFKNFTKLSRKHLCCSNFNKITGLQTSLQNTSGWLLLYYKIKPVSLFSHVWLCNIIFWISFFDTKVYKDTSDKVQIKLFTKSTEINRTSNLSTKKFRKPRKILNKSYPIAKSQNNQNILWWKRKTNLDNMRNGFVQRSCNQVSTTNLPNLPV